VCGSGPSTKSVCSIPYNPVPLRGEYGFKTPEGGLSHNIWADKLGVPIAAHAIGREGIRNCLRAGVDTIEHGQQLALDLTDELAAYGGCLIPASSSTDR
jgi:hypothetical protein